MNFLRLSMALRWVCFTALCLLLASPPPALAQTCSTTLTINGVTRSFQTCAVLNELQASIAWNYNGSTLEVGFTAVAAGSDGVWVAWGVNANTAPPSNFMRGAGVVLARVNGGVVSHGAFDLTSEFPSVPNTAPASTQNVVVLGQDAEFEGSTGKVYAAIVWARDTVYHGWNSGSLGPSGTVLQHDLSQILSKGVLNLTSGAVTAGVVESKRLYYNHGIVAVVGWGLLIPLGIMIARYGRPFQAADPAWFYTHIFFQASGFVLGLVAWILGQKLGDKAAYTSSKHGAIGTAILVFSILQVLAIVLRPGKEHKIRPWWNVYHHGVGYVAVILAIVNIFIGFHLLEKNRLPKTGYRNAYLAVLCIVAAIALLLEVFTWVVYFKRRSKVPSLKVGEGSHQGTRENNYPASTAYP